MEKIDRSIVQKYFAKYPNWAAIPIGCGGVILLMSMAGILGIINSNAPAGAYAGTFMMVIIGIALAAFGIVTIVNWKKKPKDQQIDDLIRSGLASLRDRALHKTGFDQSELIGETVLVWGPRFWNVGGAYLGLKKGEDNQIRFTPLGVTVINFTPDQLVCYQCAYDLTTGYPLNESTEEYFYKDVVSVSTSTQTKTWGSNMVDRMKLAQGNLSTLLRNGKLILNSAETFSLTTSGGTSIEVVLKDPKLIQRAGGGHMPMGTADKAVHTVRKMLREKKAAN